MDDEYLEGEEVLDDDVFDEEDLFIQQEINECFSVFDQKNKRSIPAKFLNKALQSLGIALTSFEVEELLEKYEKEGSIELADFHEIANERIREIDPGHHMKQSFSVFDQEGESWLSTDRFKKWMTTLGDPLTDSEAKELCKLGDPTNKGKFIYDNVIPLILH